MMSDQAPAKTKLGIGHLVALGGAALGLALLVLQMILALASKQTRVVEGQVPTSGLGGGAVINVLAQTGLLAVFLAVAAIALLMARKNAKLNTMVYVLAAAIFLLAPVSALSHLGRAPDVTFYFLFCVLTFVVGALSTTGALTLPTARDVRGVAEVMHHEGASAKPAKEEREARGEEAPGEQQEEAGGEEPRADEPGNHEPDLPDVPLA